jgi:hypothetical protein
MRSNAMVDLTDTTGPAGPGLRFEVIGRVAYTCGLRPAGLVEHQKRL